MDKALLLFLLINGSNIVHLTAYLVTDMVWLRTLSVIGGFLSMAWTVLQPEWHADWIMWSVFYNAVNVVQIVRLILERRPVRLTDDEQRLYSTVFRALGPRDFKRLLGVGRWEKAEPGTRLVEQDAALDRMLVLTDGSVAVKVNDTAVATLGAGRFVGEMSFLGGGKTSAAVDVVESARYVCWPREELERFLKSNPDVRSAIQLLIGKDLVAKLARPKDALASTSTSAAAQPPAS